MKLIELKTQPNEKRCGETVERHVLDLPPCCPMTKNPQPGSKISIRYRPSKLLLEVQNLSDYIKSYIGGRLDVRSMEGMVQNIAQDAANAIGVKVTVKTKLRLVPEQIMEVKCKAWPTI